MKVLILLSFLAFSAIQAAEPEVENGMFNAVFNYLKSQPVLLKEEQRQVSIKVLIFISVFKDFYMYSKRKDLFTCLCTLKSLYVRRCTFLLKKFVILPNSSTGFQSLME